MDNDYTASHDPFEKHNGVMAHIKSTDAEGNIELYRLFIDYYSSLGFDLPTIDENVHFRIYSPLWDDLNDAQKNDQHDRVIELLKDHKPRYFLLDKLPVLDIVPLSIPEYDLIYLDLLRIELGPLYPDKFSWKLMSFYNAQDPNGPRHNYISVNSADNHFVGSILKTYNEWFKKHSSLLAPQFQEIAGEIGKSLKKNYGGIQPQRNGFTDWFIATKLGLLEIELKRIPDSSIAVLSINYSNLSKALTPVVIEKHLHEYCEWRLNRFGLVKKQRMEGPIQTGESNSTEGVKLTHAQIALKFHYNNQLINQNNAAEIALYHQQKSRTSGQILVRTFDLPTSELIRTAKGKNTVKNIEAVLPLLTGSAKLLAEKELVIAKARNSK